MNNKKTYWIVAREYAGLAEAGGVKSVVTSLAQGMKKSCWDVTVFMPLYGCTAISEVDDFDIIDNASFEIIVDGVPHRIVCTQGFFHGIKVIFVVNTHFTSKMGVYTYTRLEEAMNPTLKSGEGHIDANLISVLFQKSVIHYGVKMSMNPDVFHCQDAHTSLIPYLVNQDSRLKKTYKNTKFVVTIHNAGSVYRDQFSSLSQASSLLGAAEKDLRSFVINGRVEPFLLSQQYARFTTVSPWYAQELQNPENEFSSDISKEFKKRNFSIEGITNGIDYFHYDPSNKKVSKLPFTFDPIRSDLHGKFECRNYFLKTYKSVHTCSEEKKIDRIFQSGILLNDPKSTDHPVYFAFHGRLVHQKGVDVLTKAAKIVLEKRKNVRFVVMGHGTKELEVENMNLANTFLGKYIFFQGYDKALSRLCIAICDFLVLPSFFEPCGLLDFIGQIYGTIPVAHACGGLQKIIHEKTGFLYNKNDPINLANTLIDLVDKKTKEESKLNEMITYSAQYVKNEYSWDKVISEKYLPFFL